MQMHIIPLLLALGSLAVGTPLHAPVLQASAPLPLLQAQVAPSTADANRILKAQASPFVPNLGQWDHPAKFVHRSGPMTLFVENRGWVLDLVERPREGRAEPRVDHPLGMYRAMPGDDKESQKIRSGSF